MVRLARHPENFQPHSIDKANVLAIKSTHIFLKTLLVLWSYLPIITQVSKCLYVCWCLKHHLKWFDFTLSLKGTCVVTSSEGIKSHKSFRDILFARAMHSRKTSASGLLMITQERSAESCLTCKISRGSASSWSQASSATPSAWIVLLALTENFQQMLLCVANNVFPHKASACRVFPMTDKE